MRPTGAIPDPKNARAFETIADLLRDLHDATLGITGAGGAGKTTFARNIVAHFGDSAQTIDLDDYLVSREQRGRLEITGYHPRANQLSLARDHILDLQSGKSISKPRYDHRSGKTGAVEQLEPKPLLVVEGVSTLYPIMRGLYTATFFLDALDETQIKSRIQRDVDQRGYTLDEALALFEAVRPDYIRYIKPTMRHADFVFQVDTDYVMQQEREP